MPECLGDDFILSRDARLLPPVYALREGLPRAHQAVREHCLCLCSVFLVLGKQPRGDAALAAVLRPQSRTENTDITAITIGFNSFYHQISRDGEAGKYLLLHRK